MAETEPMGATGNKVSPLKGGLLPHAATAAVVALAGIVIAFAVVAWTMGIQTGERQRDAVVNANHATLVGLFNSRIGDLTRQLQTMAVAEDTASAILSGDPERIAATENTLLSHLAGARRVALFAKGRAEVDLTASVPISFAALEVIKAAETSPFAGPEAAVNQGQLFYAAAPVTSAGRVVGVLFVVLDQQFFARPLESLPAGIGNMTIEQSFAGAQSADILSWGSGGLPEHRKSATLTAGHWTLHYDPSASVLPELLNIGGLLTPMLVCIAVVLAGIYLAFSRLSRKIGDDLIGLQRYAAKRIRGGKAQLERFGLASFQQTAIELSRVESNLLQPQATATEPATRKQAKKRTAPQPVEEPPEAPLDLSDTGTDDFLDVAAVDTPSDDNYGIEVSENISPVDLGLNLDPNIFRAYDIRGITDTNLTEEVVYWIGRAFAAQSLAENQSRACVGRDGRLSSEPLRNALVRGLTEGGVDTIDVGMVPTPLLYYATHELQTGTGIMITGSHNPPEYNGLKMMIGGVTLAEERIQDLYQRLQNNDLTEGSGSTEEVPIEQLYVDRIVSDVAVAQPLKVVIDCGNGVAGIIAPRLVEELGCEVIPLYCDVDGTFPNHHPDPAEPHTLEDLITVVQAENADLGLAFDGDGDRVGVITNSGEIIWPDKLMMLFSQDIVSRNPGADIIYDVKCSRHLNTLISEYGGRPIMWMTGHSHIKAKMKETGALLGGEFSGHICFGERWYGFDDALYSAARLLEIISAENQSVDDLFAQFPVTFTTPELKIHTTEERKFEVMDELATKADFGEGTLTTIDGLRVDYSDGWGLIRPSNTSPVLSLRFEADGQTALTRIQEVFREQLHQIDDSLDF